MAACLCDAQCLKSCHYGLMSETSDSLFSVVKPIYHPIEFGMAWESLAQGQLNHASEGKQYIIPWGWLGLRPQVLWGQLCETLLPSSQDGLHSLDLFACF
ncbi:hypothetical protein AVEN_206777-1 [Araneus ventricosus]|uniref:Uncharacterized protein n=1 Tax=Araneus ventricosus TaxID=182803 RepID=A0A4Y2C4H7_ARAVE|nr:hypothetical protein AVEN_206777-1 [Araneus ventricosus]